MQNTRSIFALIVKHAPPPHLPSRRDFISTPRGVRSDFPRRVTPFFSMRAQFFNVRASGRTLHRHACTRAVRVLFTGTPVPFEFTPLLGSLIGVVAALLLITVAILAALKMRSERRAQRPGDLPLKKATAPSSEDLYDADDRNPDVVPTNKGRYPEALLLLRGREW